MQTIMRRFLVALLVATGATGTVSAADRDGDGMADAWELDRFGNLTQAGAGSDYDQDRFTDLEEYVAGTDPTSAPSYLRALGGAAAGAARAAVAEIPAIGPGYEGLARRYEIVSGPLSSGVAARWRPAAGVVATNGGFFTWTGPADAPPAAALRAHAVLEATNPALRPPAVALPGIGSSARYVQYYGADFGPSNLALLGSFAVVVLDPNVVTVTPAVVAELQARGVRYVLAYLSIGEDPPQAPVIAGDGSGPVQYSGGQFLYGSNGVASFYVDQEWDGASYVSDGLPDTNGVFGGRFVNPDAAWRDVLETQRIGSSSNLPGRSLAGLAQIAGRRISDLDTNRVNAFGFDGFFLDTIDTAGPFENTRGYYAWAAPAMRDTLQFIRERHPDAVVFANRGIFFFNPAIANGTYGIRPYDYTLRPYVHAVLFESYFLDSNPLNPTSSPYFADNRYNYAPKLMAEANRPDGFTVFCLDYEMGRGEALYAQARQEALVRNGWVHYLAPDGGIDSVGRYALTNPPPADTSPPEWDSTGSPGYATGAVPPRVGVQQVARGADTGTVVVRWDVARDQTPPVRYHVYRAADPAFTGAVVYSSVVFQVGDGWATDPTTAYANQYVISNLPDGTHYFRVRAADSATPSHEDTNTVSLSVTLGGPPAFSNALAAVTFDGALDEWAGLIPCPPDPDDVSGAANPIDWRQVYVAHNSNDLFLAYSNDPPVTLTGSFHFYLDTDRSRLTGFRGGADDFPLGAEYAVLGGAVYQYAGSGLDWSWTFVGGTLYTWSATVVEQSMPWSYVGNPTEFDFFLYGDNVPAGGDTIDWYPDDAPVSAGGKSFRYAR